MTIEQIKDVIDRLCIKPFGKKGVIPWDINMIAQAVHVGCLQYNVDPRLALAQGIQECHFGVNPDARKSRKTHNIYNVGNTDDGSERFFPTYEAGIRAYAHLMAREYCYRNEGDIVTPEMMINHDFVRPRGGRYASDPKYTQGIAKLVAKIDSLSKEK